VLTWTQVIARRLARSHLLDPAPPGQLVDVVRDVALIQAQVLSAAEIGIGVRTRDVTAADVRRELYERRSLVKTWALRGTLHLVPADELPLWAAAARGAEPYWESRDWLAAHDLTPKRAAALFGAIADALDGRCLTRADLTDAVERRLGRRHEQLRSGWGELLHAPAVTGRLCFGPPQGGNVTFVRADQWIGGWRDEDPHEARREVLRRYLRAYGPAKAPEFARWSGFGREAAQALFAELDLEEVRVERNRAWILRGDDGEFEVEARSIRLLPQYDAYVLGFRPREQLVPGAVKERIRQDPKGRLETVTGMPALLVDGVVTGIWRRDGTRIDVERVLPLPRGRARELAAAVERVREIAR
jgi:Winged helix DNA-binding domain